MITTLKVLALFIRRGGWWDWQTCKASVEGNF